MAVTIRNFDIKDLYEKILILRKQFREIVKGRDYSSNKILTSLHLYHVMSRVISLVEEGERYYGVRISTGGLFEGVSPAYLRGSDSFLKDRKIPYEFHPEVTVFCNSGGLHTLWEVDKLEENFPNLEYLYVPYVGSTVLDALLKKGRPLFRGKIFHVNYLPYVDEGFFPNLSTIIFSYVHGVRSQLPTGWNKIGYGFHPHVGYTLAPRGEDFLLTDSCTEVKEYKSGTSDKILEMRRFEGDLLKIDSFEEPHFPLLADWGNWK